MSTTKSTNNYNTITFPANNKLRQRAIAGKVIKSLPELKKQYSELKFVRFDDVELSWIVTNTKTDNGAIKEWIQNAEAEAIQNGVHEAFIDEAACESKSEAIALTSYMIRNLRSTPDLVDYKIGERIKFNNDTRRWELQAPTSESLESLKDRFTAFEKACYKSVTPALRRSIHVKEFSQQGQQITNAAIAGLKDLQIPTGSKIWFNKSTLSWDLGAQTEADMKVLKHLLYDLMSDVIHGPSTKVPKAVQTLPSALDFPSLPSTNAAV
jgi:hypothetical protein